MLDHDLNLVVLRGTMSADPELRVFESGSRLVRYLFTIRSDIPKRRVDVVPVVLWDPSDDLWADPGVKGRRATAMGAVQRRFWEDVDGRRSRVEVVAEQVEMEAEDSSVREAS